MRFIVDDSAFTIESLDGESQARSWFADDAFAMLSQWWTLASWQRRYSYQFRWLGRPIIQLPADVMMMQELIWRTRPDVIIETGIAHGGSVVLHASILKLVHECSHVQPAPECCEGSKSRPRVIAIDIEIRPENLAALKAHPLQPFYTLLEGSSIEATTAERVRQMLRADDRVMVVLDSNHTRDHVLTELHAYAPIVSPGSALVVMDGIMADLAHVPGGSREWERDHPGRAIAEFMVTPLGRQFAIDHSFDSYALTHSPGGVLVRRDGAGE